MPAVQPKVAFAKPFVDDREAVAVQEVVRSGWLMQGPKVAEFEERFAAYCGTAAAIAVTSGTTALHLSLIGMGIGPGDEVICPSLSFIATANSIRYTGATPIFADVDLQTYNLDPDAVEAVISPRTKAVMVVHQIGLPADIDRFLALGDKHGVKIMEDAACAIGSRYRGRPIGGHSEMACFSLHPRKIITTGEGGMITTNDLGMAQRLRILRQHGMDASVLDRDRAGTVRIERYPYLGYNYRMTDIQAAIGIEQMKKLDEILARRRALGQRYAEALSTHPWLRPPYVPDYAEPTFQSYAVQLADSAPISRDGLMQRMLDAGIATRRGVMLAHREAPYAECEARGTLHNSEKASDRSMLLPIYPQMRDEEQQTVVTSLWRIASSMSGK